MNDPTHYPLSDTLRGIRLRAGFTVPALAHRLDVPEHCIMDFEERVLPDQALLDVYGRMARGKEAYSKP